MITPNISGAGLGLDFLSGSSNSVVNPSRNSSPPYEEESNLVSAIPGTLSASKPSILQSVLAPPSFLYNLEPNKCPYDDSSPTAAPRNEPRPLARHGTLLSAIAAPRRSIAELGSIMGDSTSRLKTGAMVLSYLEQPHQTERTLLEQAKTRARVEVDIILDSNIYVQGSYLQGRVKIKILECNRNEVPVMISGGKVRVIGFESISAQLDKYPFYRCSMPLDCVTVTSASCRDSEGFAQAIEGEHTLPFSMYLPMSTDYGIPKGSMQIQSEVAVGYIAMASIKVKDPISNCRSIAHFYRNCEIWPRLDPSLILAPAVKPLQVKSETNADPHLAGSRRINLAASVHRLHWVAGQQCFVKVSVANKSKKTVKRIDLALIRTTIVFKPDYRANAAFEGDEACNGCPTSTTQKLVAQSVLEMGRRGAPRYASAKGWWPGVAPGEHLEFSHSILLPLDALSVGRSRLLQVDYSVRVTLNAGGTLKKIDLQVSLPIQIINFISIDPPPLPELLLSDLLQHKDSSSSVSTSAVLHTLGKTKMGALQPSGEEDEERLATTGHGNEMHIAPYHSNLAPDNAFESNGHDSDGDSTEHAHHDMDNPSEDLECFLYEDDADEIVPCILQDDPQFENAPRFADLYYASVQDFKLSSGSHPREEQMNCSSTQYQASLMQKVREYTMLHSGLHSDSPPLTHSKSRGSSSFSSRVQAKLAAVAEKSVYGHVNSDSGFPGSGSSKDTDRESSICLNLGNPHFTLQPHSYVHDTTGSGRSLAWDDKRPAQAALPVSDSTSSLPYTRDSTFTSEGGVRSRLLPKPPVIMSIDSAPGYPMEELVSIGCTMHSLAPDATQLSTFLLPPGTDQTPTKSSKHQEQALTPEEVQDVDVDQAKHSLRVRTGVLPRPSLLTVRESQTGSTTNGSTNSVKERIRELEERQQLLQLNECNGVRSFV